MPQSIRTMSHIIYVIEDHLRFMYTLQCTCACIYNFNSLMLLSSVDDVMGGSGIGTEEHMHMYIELHVYSKISQFQRLNVTHMGFMWYRY